MPYSTAPNYECVPLRSEEVTICAMQSRLRNVDTSTPETAQAGKMENIKHMKRLVAEAQGWGKKDIICFHESPIGGYSPAWKKPDFMLAGINFPEGEEIDAIGKIAQRYNCYIEFGCYAKLEEWPGHFVNMAAIVSPEGKVIYGRWKSRNLSAFADLGSTVYDVLDDFTKRYGWDQVFPVCRTDIGNIAIIPEIGEPEMARVFAMKGVEILIRYMTLGAGHWSTSPLGGPHGGSDNTFIMDLQGCCIASGIYGVFVNNSVDIAEDMILDTGCGHSCVIDPEGRVLIEASSPLTTWATTTIPLAAYRKRHWIPRFPKELYAHAYDDYTPRFPTNSYIEKQPETLQDLLQHYNGIARW